MSCATLWAADNAVILTPGTGVTMRTVDVGAGVQSSAVILGSTAGAAIYGTAGTANANVLTIQGIASGTVVPISGTLSTVTTVTTVSTVTNLAQMNGAALLMGNGVTGTGSQRVTIASDNTAFTVNAAQSGTWNVTNVSGTVSLPTGASTAANQTSVIGTKNAGTAATNSLLAGGVFNSTPLTVADTQQSSLQVDANGFLKVNVAAGGASGGTSSSFAAAFPATGTAVGMSQGGNMVALTGTSNNLNVQCANCSGSGVSTADEATFTAGTSLFAGVGGFFQTTATNNALTNGQQGMLQMTAQRAGFVNLRAVGGTEIGTNAAEVFVGGRGTAGSAAGGVLTVQGVASMTKLLVTPDSVALPANQSVNVSQINAVTVLMGNGATGTGSQRVTLANDNTLPTGWASSVTQGSTTSGQTGPLAQCAVTTAAPTYTTAQTDPLSCDTTGNLRVNVVSATGLAQGSTTSGQTGSLVMGAVTTAAPTYTTAQTSPLSLTTAGDLRTVFSNTTLAVTNAGTFAVQIAANSSVNVAQIGGTTVVNGGVAGSQSVGGTVATNVAITDNPVNTGGQAVSSENAAVTTARKVQFVADLVGKQIVLPYANPENFVSGAITSAMTGTTSTSLVAAPASGLRNYITQCTASNSHATVGTDIILQDGSGGTTLYTIPAAPAYGGATLTFPTPLRQPTTATALFVANVTTGSNTKISCSGYKGA